MGKLTREQKIEIYKKRKQGISYKQLSNQYGIRRTNIIYLVRLIDSHGVEILRQDRNRYYSPALKEEIINKVIKDDKSILSTAIEYGLSSDGMLHTWINDYKANGCVIIEKPKGRKSIMKKNNKPEKKYEDMTAEEKVKYLEDRNLYLEAENEYLKKLRAVVQQRKEQQSTKK